MASNKVPQNNNVKVMVKIRPLIDREIESNEKECWQKVSDTEIIELDVPAPTIPGVYDHVFGGMDSAKAIYENAISHIVDSCVQGFNGSVMAYGQTASGKTYTMMGDEINPGIIRLVAENIFDIVEQHDDRDIYIVRCSFLEIYNEKVNDLLSPDKTNLEIFETTDGNVMIKNATEKVVKKAKNMIDLIELGNETKQMGETAANDRSSRSHTIFRIMIESQEEHQNGTSIKMGTLDLVDLAGSESVNKTKASGDRLKEGICINKSLLELGRVIKELSEKKEGEDKFIVFRNSKLTRVIQHSLGGNAKSVVICTISPAEREETKNTLRFASRAKNVRNSPRLNEIMSDQAMIRRLNQEINGLRKQIEQMRGGKPGHITETSQKDIIERIERCEMQFIRSKKYSKKQERRRQTWHHTADMLNNRQDSNESDQDIVRALMMPPPPPIFTTQRGSDAVHNYETFQLPALDKDEYFEPGETVSFNRLTSKIHTPNVLRENIDSKLPHPPIGNTTTFCSRCNELERELEELEEFTKLEELNHVHDESSKISCNELIEQLKLELLETRNMINMQNAEIDSLKLIVENSNNLLEQTTRAKEAAVKEKEIKESHCAGVEYELEALKTKYEQREKELLELLEEHSSKSEVEKKVNNELLEKLKLAEKQLYDSFLTIDEKNQISKDLAAKLDEKNDELQAILKKGDEHTTNLNSKISELEKCFEEHEKDFELYRSKIADFENNISSKNDTVETLTSNILNFEELISNYVSQISTLNDKIANLEACNQKHDEKVEALKSHFVNFTSKNNHTTNLSEFLQHLSNILDINLTTENNSSICADDLACDFTLNSTDNTVTNENESQITESVDVKRSALNVSSKDIEEDASVEQSSHKLVENNDQSNHIEQLKELQNDLNQARIDIAELKKKHKHLQAEYDETSIQLVEAIQDYDKLKVENDSLKNRLDNVELNTENHNLKIQLDQAYKQIETFNLELNELRLTLEKLVPIVAEKDKLELQYQESVQQLMEKNQEIETLNKSLDDQMSTISNLVTSETDLRKTIETLTEKIHLSENKNEIDISEYKIKIDALEKEAQTAKNILNEKEVENLNLLNKINSLQKKLEEATNDKNQTNEKLLSESNKVKELSLELEATHQQVQKNIDNLDSLKSCMADKELQLNQVSQEFKQNLKEKEVLIQKVKELTSEKDQFMQQIESLRCVTIQNSPVIEEFKKLSEDMEVTSRKLEEKEKETCLMMKSLTQVNEQNSYLITEKTKLLEENAENQIKIQQLSEQLASTHGSKLEIEKQFKEQSLIAERLQQELSELLEKLNQKMLETSDLDMKVIAYQQQVDKIQSEIFSLKTKYDDLLIKNQTLTDQQSKDKNILKDNEAQINQYVIEIESLNDEKAYLCQEIEKLQTFKQQVSKKIETIDIENSDLTMKLTVAEAKIANFDEQFVQLNAKYVQASVELESSKKLLCDVQTNLNTANEKIASLQKYISLKEQQLHDLTEKLKLQEAKWEQHKNDMFELDDLRKRTVKDRRSRRQSAHDELRPLVRSLKPAAVQTEPTDENCQCRALNEKLEKLKMDLLKAKVTADHYKLGNDQKVGDIKEEKQKVEQKLKEALEEVNRLGQEAVRIRRERETLRERLVKAYSEMNHCSKCQERSARQMKTQEIQTDLQMPIVNMNSDSVSLEQKIYIKKLEDDLAIQLKKYENCKKIAREKIREKEAELTALRNGSLTVGKENISNNSQFMNEICQLKKENAELVQHYNHYKTLYLTKPPQTLKLDSQTQTESALHNLPDDCQTIVRERDVYEGKYRKAAQLFNICKKNLEEYKKNYVICAAENRALATALSRYDKDYTPKPIEEIDEMYQTGYEEWEKQNPEFVQQFILGKKSK